ncbi:MAG: helix-turn-helix domain-containing protein [Acidimicrobiia bacterium]
MTAVNSQERRNRQIERTRADIVSAAAELFADNGYAGTTIQNIASRAGVVVQTIYNSIGSKSSVLSAVLDRAAAGPEAPKPVRAFMQERTEAMADAAGLIEILADWFAEVQPRTSEVHDIIRQAAAHDEDIAKLEEQRAAQRFNNYLLAAEQLTMRAGSATWPDEEIAATIWSIGHPQVYRFLTEGAGWDLDRYRDWVQQSLRSALTETATV